MLIRALLLAAPLLAAGCITGTLSRANTDEPVVSAEWSQFERGTEMSECLARLGAPLRVWPLNGQTLLVYGWKKTFGWGVRVSIPVTDNVSASLDYDDDRANQRGVVLTFDDDLRLLFVEKGELAEIEPERPYPAALEIPEGDETATTNIPAEYDDD